MRYFYKDPLAAAWMAKHFGMRFTCQGNGYDPQQGKPFGIEVLFHFLDTGYANNLLPVRIQFDSLHLLEPQPKDLVFYEYGYGDHRGEVWDEVKAVIRHNDEGYPYTGNGEAYILCDGGESFGVSRLKRIIQRQGTPFHWPESEAA